MITISSRKKIQNKKKIKEKIIVIGWIKEE